MRMLLIAALLSAASASALDGGVDAPYLDLDAGVAQVDVAQLSGDAGYVGAGWWLSDERMLHVGQALAERRGMPAGFWVGCAAGATVTGLASFFVIRELVKREVIP